MKYRKIFAAFVWVMLTPVSALANGPILEMMVGLGLLTVGLVVALTVALISIVKIPKELGQEERRKRIVRALTVFARYASVIFALVFASFFIWIALQ